MPSLDLANRLSGAASMVPAAIRTTTTTGTAIDLNALNKGANGLTIFVLAGAITDGTHTFKLQDSSDNSTYNDVVAPYIQNPTTVAFTSATASGTVLKFGYLGLNRYVKLICTVTGSPSTGGYYSAIAVEGQVFNLPAA